MPKKEKLVKIKHYFTLTEEINKKFTDFVDVNFINKPKLIESLIIQYLIKNNIK